MREKRLAREERFQLEKPSDANGAIRAGTLHESFEKQLLQAFLRHSHPKTFLNASNN